MSINNLRKLANNLKSHSQTHSERRLQTSWNLAQLGLLLFPLIPILGATSLVLAIAGTWKQKFSSIIRRPLNRGFALLSICLAITASLGKEPLEALLGLGNLLPFFLVFAGFSALIQTPAQLRHLSWLLVLASLPVVILGLGQQFLGWSGPLPLYPILGWVLEANGNPPGRMSSVFMYANIFACYLTLVFTLALGLWIEEWRKLDQIRSLTQLIKALKYPQKRDDQKKPSRQFPILTLALIGNAICIIFTNSRNAWGLAIFTCLAFAFYVGWRWLIAVVATVTGGAFWAAFGPPTVRGWLRTIFPYFIWGRITDQMYANRPVETLRTTQWQFAWKMTQERPWTGWGLRNFTPLYEAQMHVWLGHPHNLFLMLTAEAGIPTTLLFCSLVGWILAQGILRLVSVKKEKNLINFQGQNEQFYIDKSWGGESDRLILFSYLIAFIACTLFNTVDVTLFDFRVNTLGWLLLAAISGVVDCFSGKIEEEKLGI